MELVEIHCAWPVIPTLVGNATLPHETDLPESVKDIVYRQACAIGTNGSYEKDIIRLAKAAQILANENSGSLGDEWRESMRLRRKVTYLRPEGSVVAETASAVARLSEFNRKRFLVKAIPLALLATIGLIFLTVFGLPALTKALQPNADVIIAKFVGENEDFRPSRQIETEIRRKLREAGLDAVSVDVTERPLVRDAQIEEVVDEGHHLAD